MKQNISDETINRAAQGDQEAFESLYRSFSKFVYSVSWRIVHTHEDAQEVTQEVFLTVYRKLGSFRFQSAFKTWLYRITINQALNYSKKMSKHNQRRTEYDDQLHSFVVSGEMNEAINKEYNENIIAELLKVLTPDQKVCIVLRNIEGLSYQEMAETLNININTVRSRLKRARETLLAIRKEVVSNEL